MNILRRSSTPLATYRPGQFDDQFSRMVEHMFDDFFAPLAQGGAGRHGADDVTAPRINVAETDAAFEVEAELPGVNKDDVKVSVEQQRVTIEAESRRDAASKTDEKLVYAERGSRKYLRSFTLPSDVDDSKARARLENGVLLLSLPKKQGSQAKRLTVQ